MVSIEAVGIDAALANMGFAHVRITMDMGVIQVECLHLHLSSTKLEDAKVVRKSSDNLRRAQQHHEALRLYTQPPVKIAFAEIPHGGALSSQAARAMGMAVGILAACTIPMIEVSPMEVKRLFPSKNGETKKAASKAQIIEWAIKQWPQAPWLKHNGKITQANEHLADALAAVMAGVKTPEFHRMIAFHHASPNIALHGLTPRRRTVLRI